MTIAAAVAFVVTAVQFVKKVFPFISGKIAIGLVVLASAAVSLYKFLSEGLPLGLDTILFFIQVVIGALGAYSLVKVATNK